MDCKEPGKIDLHIHSTASDGSYSPAEILARAQILNLGAIAIVDHDTLEGSKEALSIGTPPNLKFVTGVEISATPPAALPATGSFHILGYGIRLNDPVLNQTLEKLQKARKDRNPLIVRKLQQLGIPLTLDEVRTEAGEGQLGRPHIARCMVKKGFAASIDEAFDNYLGKGRPAYVDKFRVDCSKAIEIISKAGGVPVMAHPFLITTELGAAFEDLVLSLKSMGLKGIEVYYPEHPAGHTAFYAELARRHDLLMTGGSDFHGLLKPDVHMGTGRGNLFVPYELYEKLNSELLNL